MHDEPTTRVKLCGGVAVRLAGREVDAGLGGRQCRILLAYLALHRDRAIRRDELIDALWPDEAPTDPAASLDTLLSRLRKTLDADIVRGRAALRLCLPPDGEVDVESASEAVRRAEQALEHGHWDAVAQAADAALAIVDAG